MVLSFIYHNVNNNNNNKSNSKLHVNSFNCLAFARQLIKLMNLKFKTNLSVMVRLVRKEKFFPLLNERSEGLLKVAKAPFFFFFFLFMCFVVKVKAEMVDEREREEREMI